MGLREATHIMFQLVFIWVLFELEHVWVKSARRKMKKTEEKQSPDISPDRRFFCPVVGKSETEPTEAPDKNAVSPDMYGVKRRNCPVVLRRANEHRTIVRWMKLFVRCSV